jgi:PPE-repeat protein
MIDFGALPPEINSGRMWTDIIGSEPLAEAGAAWQALAGMLGSTSAALQGVVAELTGGAWLGPSAAAMAEAAAPFAVWLAAHGAQAEETALLAIRAAASFETARLGHIHPMMIAENRSELATLVATNFLGVNSPAIAANEALYSEYWAQDAAAMYGYAADGAATTGALAGSPFLPPVPVADPAAAATQGAGVAGQSAGQASSQVAGAMGQMGGMGSSMGGLSSMMSAPSQMMSAIPQALQGLASPLGQFGQQFSSLLQPLMGMGSGLGMLGGTGGGLGSLGSLEGSVGGTGMPTGGLTASMGRAGAIGNLGPKLSVPQSWEEAAKPMRPVVLADNAGAAGAPAAESTDGNVMPRGGMMMPPVGAMGAGAGGGSSYPMPLGSLGRHGPGRPRSLPDASALPDWRF